MFLRDKTLQGFWSILAALSRPCPARHFEIWEGPGDKFDHTEACNIDVMVGIIRNQSERTSLYGFVNPTCDTHKRGCVEEKSCISIHM